MQNDIEGSFTGIGVQIRKNNIRDQLQVVTPIFGSPAYKAGLKANDIITTIVREVDSHGKPLARPESLPTKGMTTEEAVKKILGKEGSKIRLIVDREGSKEPLELNLIRAASRSSRSWASSATPTTPGTTSSIPRTRFATSA